MSEPDYNDIVYRLRNPTYWFFQIVGPHSGASVHGESSAPRDAADEIERLRTELAAERELSQAHFNTWAAEVDAREKAEAAVAKLREALEPFARLHVEPSMADDARAACCIIVTPETDRQTVTAGEICRARAMLSETKGGWDE